MICVTGRTTRQIQRREDPYCNGEIKKVSHERLTAHKHFKENSEINEDFWSNSFTLRDDRNMNEKLFAPVFVALFVVGRVGPFN